MSSGALARGLKTGLTSWFWAVFVLFFTRGLFFTTWSGRGPQLRDQMDLDYANWGWYAACLSVGSVAGVLVAEQIVHRFGPRLFSYIAYIVLGGGLLILGLSVMWHNVWLAFIVTAIMGFPFGASDYSTNLEAARIDQRSGKSRVPVLHGGYSAGTMLGSSLVGLAVIAGIGLVPNFILIGIVVVIASLVAATFIRTRPQIKNPSEETEVLGAEVEHVLHPKIPQRLIWRERRTRLNGFIGFTFVFAEGVGVVWIPQAMQQFGYSESAIQWLGYVPFFAGFVIMRFVGGWLTDRLGRQRIVIMSCMILILGIVVFIATPILHVPLIGSLLWGLGDSIGLAMTVSALGDDPARAASRSTLLWTLVYLANLIVGPTIGLLSGVTGLVWSLTVPIIFIVLAAVASGAVRPEKTG